MWGAFETQTATRVRVRCGCLNIAKRSVTPDLAATYAEMSHATLTELGTRTAWLDRRALVWCFPFLDADVGRLAHDSPATYAGPRSSAATSVARQCA